jgi:hypothetical protein
VRPRSIMKIDMIIIFLDIGAFLIK